MIENFNKKMFLIVDKTCTFTKACEKQKNKKQAIHSNEMCMKNISFQ